MNTERLKRFCKGTKASYFGLRTDILALIAENEMLRSDNRGLRYEAEKWRQRAENTLLQSQQVHAELDYLREIIADRVALEPPRPILVNTAELDRLKRQLPEEMQDCTIVYKECQVGHGRLTATNWIDHGCLHCELDRLRAVEATRERHTGEMEPQP